MITQPLYIQWNTGLGDALLCNGLVRVLSETFKEIVLPAWVHNLETVRFMFSDLTGVRVEPVDFDGINTFGDNERRLRMGHYAIDGFDVKIFDQEFYRQAGVPFEARWLRFYVPWISNHIFSEVLNGRKPFSLLHEDKERGFKVNEELIKRPPVKIFKETDGNFFDKIQLLEEAEEIHCINSSFLILCDSLPPVEGQKLFLHHYARPTDYPTLKKHWTVLK